MKKLLAITLFFNCLTLQSQDVMKLNRGYLFSFEGIDGSGKTTVMNLVAKKLHDLDYTVITTREPGATELGKNLRSLLMNKTAPTCTLAEFLLFAADRAQHFHELILPQLKACSIVLSDRMADSSVVYQGYVKGLDQTTIETINAWAMQQHQPDIVFYLKVDAQTAINRINHRNETAIPFEQEILEKKQYIIDGFDAILKNRSNAYIIDSTNSFKNEKNVITIDSDATAEYIADLIVYKIIIQYITTTEKNESDK